MYNKLLLKRPEDGRIHTAFHGNLVDAEVSIRIDFDEEDEYDRVMTELTLKEVDALIEYLQEFKRLTENGR